MGCTTNDDVITRINHTEAIAIDHPDSALHIMQSVDTTTLRGQHDIAHYRHIMAEACYYNYITPNRSSIVEPLFAN